jgi:hypothetical protein
VKNLQRFELGRTLSGFCLAVLLLSFSASTQAQAFLLHGHRAHLAAASAGTGIAGAPTLRSTDPVPIPGGDMFIPPTVSHIFAPGPTDQGFDGLDVEPNGITNFRGLAALAYVTGNASDTNGNSYFMFSDMRLFQGEYVAADGSHHVGTFVFI